MGESASLVAQMEKNLPAMQGTRVQSLGQGDPLEEEMVTIPVFLLREFHQLLSVGWQRVRYN